MRALATIALVALSSYSFAYDVETVNKQIHLRSGYRWDQVTQTGNLGDIVISPAPTGIVDGREIKREIKNLNLWNFELGASALFDNYILLSGKLAYGVFIDRPTEVFSGYITNSDNISSLITNDNTYSDLISTTSDFSKIYVKELNHFNCRNFSLDTEISVGAKLTLFNNHVTCIPKLGLGVYKLSITGSNQVLTWGGFIGTSLLYPIKKGLTLGGSYCYHFKGSRREEIKILASDGITFEPGTLSNGGFHGSSFDASIQWRWAKRWTLDLGWELRYLWANPEPSSAFGGTAFLKTAWLSQNVALAVKYSF